MNRENLVHAFCAIVLATVWVHIILGVMIMLSGCTTTQLHPTTATANVDCPPPEVINNTPEWTSRDEHQLVIAKQECRRRYGPQSCVKVLTKVRENGFTVLCRSH